MRTLSTLTVVVILILAAGSASAENFRQDYNKMDTYMPPDNIPASSGRAALHLSPMYLEIHRINEATTESERKLLVKLAASQDEDEVMQIVYRLERLETERQIDVLKVKIRYSKISGQYDQAFRLQRELLMILQRDQAPPM